MNDALYMAALIVAAFAVAVAVGFIFGMYCAYCVEMETENGED